MDLTTLDDDELDEHRRAVQTEQERRRRLADVPVQVADAARRFIEDGGDPAILQAAITDAAAPTEP
ncbi:MAG TPA: hypothetical protein VMF51_18330 [Nocardioides sp.]|uniref:hypothetical protein n=1 Tax=Nocardioides sp. TaxID=35761 RepID=UPI002C187F89|nr:hypothetical protein [Nocardioides sp.]HTW17094.1 hypothetical protein [Nocardioides sp.]